MYIDITLLTFHAIAAFGLVRMHGLIGVTMMSGIFSLLSAAIFMRMDAVDVAFTEAAVGAGMTTVLLLATLAIVGNTEKEIKSIHWPSLALVLCLIICICSTMLAAQPTLKYRYQGHWRSTTSYWENARDTWCPGSLGNALARHPKFLWPPILDIAVDKTVMNEIPLR